MVPPPPLFADVSTLLTVCGILVVVIALIYDQQKKSQDAISWSQAAVARGLRLDDTFVIRGDVGDFSVEARSFTTSSGKNRTTRTEVTVEGNLPRGLSLGAEHFFSKLLGDVSLGDRAFDDVVKVGGDPMLALAVLDASARALVPAAVRAGWVFEDATWKFGTNGRERDIGRRIDDGVALARAFALRRRNLSTRLAERVTSEPEAPLRERALEYLLRDYPDHKETRAALAVALQDRSPAVRIVAARRVGDLGVVAAVALDPAASDETRADAIAMLAARWSNEALTVGAIGELAGRLASFPRATRAAVASALAYVRHADPQPILIAALGDEEEEVRVATARTLGAIGTVDAVPALAPHRDRFLGSALKSAARDAILSIQARVAGGGAGALALAADGGGLSFSSPEGETPAPDPRDPQRGAAAFEGDGGSEAVAGVVHDLADHAPGPDR